MNKKQFVSYLKEKCRRHIIFDFDETLCTLLIDWSNWEKELQKLFSSYNLTSGDSDFEYAKMINLCVEKYGDEARDKILEINYRNEKDYSSGYDLSPIAIDLLKTSRDHANLYL